MGAKTDTGAQTVHLIESSCQSRSMALRMVYRSTSLKGIRVLKTDLQLVGLPHTLEMKLHTEN
jgi:hypothetical protein